MKTLSTEMKCQTPGCGVTMLVTWEASPHGSVGMMPGVSCPKCQVEKLVPSKLVALDVKWHEGMQEWERIFPKA